MKVLLDAYPYYVMLVDAEHRIVVANEATCQAINRTSAELQGKVCLREIHGQEEAYAGCPMAQAVNTGEPAQVDYHDEQSGIWIRSSMFPTQFCTADGERVYLHHTRDITDQVEMKQHLARTDRMVSIGMLAAGVAHEINNPLTYVLFNLEILEEELRSRGGPQVKEDQEAHDLTGDALQGVLRIRDIVRDLKAFSHVDEGETERLDVNAIMDGALKMAHNEIKHRATVQKSFGELQAVLGNPGKLSQVFLNLLVNAAQAMDDGDATQNRISLITSAEPDHVVIEVSDTGEGIPEDRLPHIFEPFHTSKPAGEGTGLGLSICQKIVAALGGSIVAHSKPGKGSTFRVRLPVAPHETAQEAAVEPDGQTPAGSAARGGKILVVDDETFITRVIHRILSPRYDVRLANSGLEAQEIIESSPDLDLILSDLQMPVTTGMDLHDWVAREHPELIEKMIFMSGGAFSRRAEEFLNGREHLCLTKPLDRAQLLKVAKSRTSGRARPEEKRPPAAERRVGNCWEYKKCGREVGGARLKKLGCCPAATATLCDGVNGGKNGGRFCWQVAGTFCGGEVQGSFADKVLDCLQCDFYLAVEREEGAGFVTTADDDD